MSCCSIDTYTRLYNAILPVMPYYASFTVSPPVVPEEYWNVKSQEQRIEWLACNIKKLICYVNELCTNINLADDEIEALANEFEKFKESGFDDYYADQVEAWINSQLPYIYSHTIKQIYFALDDSGHLIAFIPDSWTDIDFWTPLNYDNQATYGHLQILLKNTVSYIEMED